MKHFAALGLAFGLSLPPLPLMAMAASPDLTEFRPVTSEFYLDAEHGFSIDYPYLWILKTPEEEGEIFGASSGGYPPSIRIDVKKRIEGLSLDKSAAAAAKPLGASAITKSSRAFDLNGTPASEVIVEWTLPGKPAIHLRSILVSVYRGEDWIIVTGTDGLVPTGLRSDLTQAISSIKILPVAGKGVGQ